MSEATPVEIAPTAKIGSSVVFAGDGIILRERTRLDAGCVIGEGVTIGQGAWVRAGAVVLRSRCALCDLAADRPPWLQPPDDPGGCSLPSPVSARFT